MTPDELWRAVGKLLREQRNERHWQLIDVQRAGGPTYATVDRNEFGKISSTKSLRKHCSALGLEMVDVLRSVLMPKEAQLSPEAQAVLRKFHQTTNEGRAVLLAVAKQLPDAPAQEQKH